MSPYQDRLEFALLMSSAAAEVILQYYQSGGLSVESKSDDSPVTIADKSAEKLMREMLLERYPNDGVLGEEFADKPGTNGFRWILDPIDGTKPFIYGVPLFGTLIGVEFEGRMVAGVSAFPALKEVVYAAEGGGTWWRVADARPVQTHVTPEADLSRARMMFTEPSSWVAVNRFDILADTMRKVRIARGWGDCYGHAMVATGRAEMAIDPIMSPWDIAALVPILREAGGACVDWRGDENIYGGDGISVNAAMKESVVALFRDVPPIS